MNNNIIPSLIIATSILVSGIILKYEIDTKISFSEHEFLNSIEKITSEKDKDGNTRIKNSVTALIGEVASGVKEGFQKGFKSDDDGVTEGLKDIEISQIKFTSGRMDNEEKIIGIIKNNGKSNISDIELNVVVKDKEGKLIDVVSSFTRVDGILLPNSELGFAIDRSLGGFGSEKEKMDKNKGDTAQIKISKMKVVKNKN